MLRVPVVLFLTTLAVRMPVPSKEARLSLRSPFNRG